VRRAISKWNNLVVEVVVVVLGGGREFVRLNITHSLGRCLLLLRAQSPKSGVISVCAFQCVRNYHHHHHHNNGGEVNSRACSFLCVRNYHHHHHNRGAVNSRGTILAVVTHKTASAAVVDPLRVDPGRPDSA
jgi:hypothetical protein